jgi:hypothetical protein
MDDANLKLSVADIVREIDGDKLFSGCGFGLKNVQKAILVQSIMNLSIFVRQ